MRLLVAHQQNSIVASEKKKTCNTLWFHPSTNWNQYLYLNPFIISNFQQQWVESKETIYCIEREEHIERDDFCPHYRSIEHITSQVVYLNIIYMGLPSAPKPIYYYDCVWAACEFFQGQVVESSLLLSVQKKLSHPGLGRIWGGWGSILYIYIFHPLSHHYHKSIIGRFKWLSLLSQITFLFLFFACKFIVFRGQEREMDIHINSSINIMYFVALEIMKLFLFSFYSMININWCKLFWLLLIYSC